MATKRYSHACEYARAKPSRAILLCHAEATLELLLFPPVALIKTIPCSKRSYAPSMPRKRRLLVQYRSRHKYKAISRRRRQPWQPDRGRFGRKQIRKRKIWTRKSATSTLFGRETRICCGSWTNLTVKDEVPNPSHSPSCLQPCHLSPGLSFFLSLPSPLETLRHE